VLKPPENNGCGGFGETALPSIPDKTVQHATTEERACALRRADSFVLALNSVSFMAVSFN